MGREQGLVARFFNSKFFCRCYKTYKGSKSVKNNFVSANRRLSANLELKV